MGILFLPSDSQHLKMSRFLQVLLVLTIALTAMAHAKAFPQQRQQQQQQPQQQRPGTWYDGTFVSGTLGGDLKDYDNSFNKEEKTHIACSGQADCVGTVHYTGDGSVFN